jgi:small-conductance mechanosensitive channel
VKVDWSADADLVRRLLLEAAAEHPHVLDEPGPEVELRDLRGGLQFGLQVWSTEYLKGEGRLKSELNFAIREKLSRHRIESPVRGDRTESPR